MTSNITNQDAHVYEFLTNQINPKGIIHISHGMAEHILRYKWLISRFNDDGYHVIAKDHRGHGLSINSKKVKGFFSDKEGWNKVVSDLEAVIVDSKKKFPNLDQFLIGHSMGSWLALSLISKGILIKGLILSGSSKVPLFIINAQKLIINMQIIFFGKNSTSKLLDSLTMKSYNKSFAPNRTESDWITTDKESVDDYVKDPLCGFMVTNKLWQDLANGMKSIFNKNNYDNSAKQTPIFIISGDKDPVGENGKGVKRLYGFLLDLFPNSSMSLIKDARHEVFSEINKEFSYQEVKHFIESIK
jgi:alpha-beta hydrolase superfamily lysophospholipase